MNNEELLSCSYSVTDIGHIRRLIKRGSCSEEAYEVLTRLIAETGALIIPLSQHPEVRELLRE